MLLLTISGRQSHEYVFFETLREGNGVFVAPPLFFVLVLVDVRGERPRSVSRGREAQWLYEVQGLDPKGVLQVQTG